MTENSDLEKRLSDLERRLDKTRECLIDALALAAALPMAGAFNDYYKPASGRNVLCQGLVTPLPGPRRGGP